MDISDLLKTIGKYAPQLAGVIIKNSIPGGRVIADIAKIFNTPPDNQQALQQKIETDPAAEFKLQALHDRYAYLDDINKSNNLRWIRPLLAVIVTLGFFVIFFMIIDVKQDPADEHIIEVMWASLALGFILIMLYCFSVVSVSVIMKIVNKIFS